MKIGLSLRSSNWTLVLYAVDVIYLFNLSVELSKAGGGVSAMNYFTETKTASKLFMSIRYLSAQCRSGADHTILSL
jgi:hypothetical protein